MRRRLTLAFTGLLLLALLFAVAGTWFLAYTEPGLQLVASQVPRRIGAAQLELGEARGTLAGGFSLESFRLRHERVHIDVERIVARLDMLPLAWQTIRVREARAARATIEVRRRLKPPPKSTPRFLPRFLTIAADRLRVDEGTLIATNGRRFDVIAASASGIARHREIRLYDASLDWQALMLAASGVLHAADPMRLRGEGRFHYRTPGQPDWTGAAVLRGDLAELGVRGAITAPFRADVQGTIHELTRGLHWQAGAKILEFSLAPWGGGDALGRITGELALRGGIGDFEARGPLTPAGLEAGVFDVLFAGRYADRTVTASRIEIVHRGSKAMLAGRGTIGIVEQGPRLDLSGTWRDFRWPLVGEPAFHAPGGRYTLAGMRPFAYAAEGQLAIRELPVMPFAARGALATDRVTIDGGSLEAFDGRASFAAGEARWSPQETWRLHGSVAGFNPGRIRTDLPGSLGFVFEAAGEGFGDEGSLTVSVRELHGRVRGGAASGSGTVSLAREAWQFSGVRVRIGRTQLGLDGRLAERRDLRFSVDAEDLSLLAPGSHGRLHARGRLAGTARRPVLTLDASGAGVEHEDIELESFRADIDVDGAGAAPSRAAIDARGLVLQGRRIDVIGLDLDGTAAAHDLRVQARSDRLALEASGTGQFAEGRWALLLGQLSLRDDKRLALQNEKPARLVLSAEEQQLEPLCLKDESARVCGEGRSRSGVWTAALAATGMPLRTLTAGLGASSVTYDGMLEAEAQLAGAPDRPWQGSLRLRLADARVSHRLRSGRVNVIRLGSGSATAQADPAAIVASLEIDAGETGTIRGELTARRTAESWQEYPLRGALRARTGELGLLSLYFPEIDRAAGRLDADIVVGGTLGSPLVSGVLQLDDAELDLYQVNLALRGVDLEARLIDNGLTLAASARAGEGSAQIRGSLRWQDRQPYGELNLTGRDLRVVDVPEARIDASPNLDFKIRGRRIEVAGGVRIPYARIVPAQLTNAVLPSGDEIIVGVEQDGSGERFQVASHIMVTLGDRVSIDTSGLTGRLVGSVAVRTNTAQETTTGRGELEIVEGQYTAYGRRLDITRGRLIFGGGLINDPGVDIRAVKQFPDIEAGVNVRGTLLQPRLTFFSEPTIPQTQIVSLILAGGSLESAQNDPTSGSTRNELLTQGGAILAAEIGSRLGLEQVTVESTLDNDTSLVLGKYLSPRLYVSYGISLTESINTFKARYTLGDRWTIKTESGREQSAELVYTIEK